MKGILVATLVALLVVVGLIFLQSRDSSDEPAPVAAMAPASEAEPVAEEAASNEVGEEAPQEEAPVEQAEEAPHSDGMATHTAEGREIVTMNKEEVLTALDGGAEQVLAMRKQMEELQAAGDTEAYETLKAKHDQVEREMLDLANRGISLQKGE